MVVARHKTIDLGPWALYNGANCLGFLSIIASIPRDPNPSLECVFPSVYESF